MEGLQKLFYAFVGTCVMLIIIPMLLQFFGANVGEYMVYMIWITAMIWFTVFLPENASTINLVN